MRAAAIIFALAASSMMIFPSNGFRLQALWSGVSSTLQRQPKEQQKKRHATVQMQNVDPVRILKDYLKEGTITQAEYDELIEEAKQVGTVSKNEYEKMTGQGKVDPKLLAKMQSDLDSKMKSQGGVEFAPWMKLDAERLARGEMKRPGDADETETEDGIPDKIQSGVLNTKVISDSEIQLTWQTSDEKGNAGFILQRRTGGQDDFEFEDIASFKTNKELKSKGGRGGQYGYLDEVPRTGIWAYRLLDQSNRGQQSAIGLKSVEVVGQAQKFAQIAAIGILGLALVGAFVLTGGSA